MRCSSANLGCRIRSRFRPFCIAVSAATGPSASVCCCCGRHEPTWGVPTRAPRIIRCPYTTRRPPWTVVVVAGSIVCGRRHFAVRLRWIGGSSGWRLRHSLPKPVRDFTGSGLQYYPRCAARVGSSRDSACSHRCGRHQVLYRAANGTRPFSYGTTARETLGGRERPSGYCAANVRISIWPRATAP